MVFTVDTQGPTESPWKALVYSNTKKREKASHTRSGRECTCPHVPSLKLSPCVEEEAIATGVTTSPTLHGIGAWSVHGFPGRGSPSGLLYQDSTTGNMMWSAPPSGSGLWWRWWWWSVWSIRHFALCGPRWKISWLPQGASRERELCKQSQARLWTYRLLKYLDMCVCVRQSRSWPTPKVTPLCVSVPVLIYKQVFHTVWPSVGSCSTTSTSEHHLPAVCFCIAILLHQGPTVRQ